MDIQVVSLAVHTRCRNNSCALGLKALGFLKVQCILIYFSFFSKTVLRDNNLLRLFRLVYKITAVL
ncbi:hypothetical protein HBH56_101120 [Parastagonospora nodorum]|uniref:Uncharacterized protein n=1 Tax=Phaeosphaeria nodorum (strain SN15 / ATCC MYA-4574 / FGSC 10173) TaxID=321614 RepID=A0A7U2FFW7_PHANO|nr:hypothetical protein HBH56_101120 [Parastagonospora nodorum]QRD04408.1 hypothetical protein JI435_421090 [Parastagonospora nodorum SN15]KAH3929276.1 hypothetical protein HBH54_129310 [Parastagonospora nodorum]KAH3999195.1 hypothetical protein HBI10_117130 [Parastagonospora nodorum]KAH4025305.1 hypothetical protein HBI13_080040 [Parastagonospora nodorum]